MMIAEFERQKGVWLLWPTRNDIWRHNGLPAQKHLCDLIGKVASAQSVTLGVPPGQLGSVREKVPRSVRVVELHYDDVWIRDTGPVFVRTEGGRIGGVSFSFNAWGGVYTPYCADAQLAKRILEIEGVSAVQSQIILEGGAITTDGLGTIIATKECVLNKNRGLDGKEEYFETELRALLGAKKIIWLPSGLSQDETGGHVDQLCVFSRHGQVLLSWTDEPGENYHVCRAALGVLEQETDSDGRKLDVVKIELPDQIIMTEVESKGYAINPNSLPRRCGDLFATSYVNFCFLNDIILLPQFEQPINDRRAISQFSEIFPEREIVPVPCREFILGGGAIHCLIKEVYG